MEPWGMLPIILSMSIIAFTIMAVAALSSR